MRKNAEGEMVISLIAASRAQLIISNFKRLEDVTDELKSLWAIAARNTLATLREETTRRIAVNA